MNLRLRLELRASIFTLSKTFLTGEDNSGRVKFQSEAVDVSPRIERFELGKRLNTGKFKNYGRPYFPAPNALSRGKRWSTGKLKSTVVHISPAPNASNKGGRWSLGKLNLNLISTVANNSPGTKRFKPGRTVEHR